MITSNANGTPLAVAWIRSMLIDRLPKELEGHKTELRGHAAQRLAFYISLASLLSSDKNETVAEHKLRSELIEYFTGGLSFKSYADIPKTEVRIAVDGSVLAEIVGLAVPVGYEEE